MTTTGITAPKARLRTPILGAVLIGGASSRMGRAKALLEFGGKPLARIAAEALSPWVSELTWVGSPPGARRASEAPVGDWSRELGIPWRRLADRPRVGGPLGGLLACFDAEPEATWIVCACDLPLLRSETVGWLLDQRLAGDLAVWPRANGRLHPLTAIYCPAAGALLEARAASGQLSLHPFATTPGLRVVEAPAELTADFTNVNTVRDWSSFLAAR